MDKLKYKILFTEGDSWTSGDIIDPSLVKELNGHVNSIKNDNFRLPKVWPSKLGKHLGLSVINQAVAGSSNDGIVRRTVNSIIGLLKKNNPEDILVIIGLSSPERKDFFYSKDNEANWDTLYPLDNFENSKDRQNFKRSYIECYWNEFEYISRYINSVIYLNYFLQSKNIDHLFFNGFYQDDSGLFNSQSLFNIIEKFKDKHKDMFLEHIGISNLFEELNNIKNNFFINTSFKSFIDNQPGVKTIPNSTYYSNYHPSENGHKVWAQFLANFILEKDNKCLHDPLNTATFHNISDNVIEIYKNIPEIKEKDSRGYEMIRPLYSLSGLNYTLGIDAVDSKSFDFDNNFYYFVFCHHNLNSVGKYINIIPDYVLEGLRNNKCKLILDDSLEGKPINYICDSLYSSIENLGLNPSQIFYITNNLFAEKQHKYYIDKHSITDPINIIAYMYNVYDVQRLIHSNDVIKGGKLPKRLDINKLIDYKKNKLPSIKTFLKVNRTGRPERNLFMLFINKFNLYKKFKISFPEYGEEGDYNLFPSLTTEENIENLKSKIPFDIDQTDKDNHGPPGSGVGNFDADLPFQIKNYDDTFISIVFCAFPFDDACHLHSSTFNPIYCGHPIIQFGPKGSLQELRNRGFKTFNKWWDESYDNADNGWDRFRMILEIVKSLSKKTNEELLEMYIEMKDTLEYNSELIYNYDINNKLVNRVRFRDGR